MEFEDVDLIVDFWRNLVVATMGVSVHAASLKLEPLTGQTQHYRFPYDTLNRRVQEARVGGMRVKFKRNSYGECVNNFLKWVEKINNRLVGADPNAVQVVPELKPLNFGGMDLDEKWQEVFRLIHQAGGHKSKGILDLDSTSRRKIFFNGYAMLFGIFYYIKLGMVKRGLMLLLASVVVGIILLLFVWMFITLNFMLGWFSMTIVFAFLCNRDYYNYKVNGVDEFSLR